MAAYYPAPVGLGRRHPRRGRGRGALAGFGVSRSARYEFVLASSLVYDRYFEFPDASPAFRSFYERLFAEGLLVVSFEAPPGGGYLFQNPTMRLYRLRPSPR